MTPGGLIRGQPLRLGDAPSEVTRRSGTGVGSTVTSYYTAGAHNPAGCISSTWTGLVCTSGPAAQALTGGQPDLPTTRYSCDYLLRPTVLTQTVAGAPDRVNTTTYEQGGLSPRPASSQTTGGEGTALPASVPHYDSAGRVDSSQFTDGTGALSTGYDDFGRPVRSTDADGFVTTTSYDSHGRPAVVVGKQTLTYGYDSAGTNEHRGMLTSLSASDVSANPFTAGYDADGKLLSQTFPDTLVQTISYDETADPTGLAYRRGSTAVIADDSQLSNIHGQWTHHEGQGSSAEFSCDNAGRLIQVGDRASSVNAGSCTSRSYGWFSSRSPKFSRVFGRFGLENGGDTWIMLLIGAERPLEEQDFMLQHCPREVLRVRGSLANEVACDRLHRLGDDDVRRKHLMVEGRYNVNESCCGQHHLAECCRHMCCLGIC